MSPKRRGVTSSHIAKMLGISQTTVSRALNGHAVVKESTRQRILETANKLGYELNSAARSLVHGRTGTLGVLVDNIPTEERSNVYLSRVVFAAVAACSARHISVCLGSSTREGDLEAPPFTRNRVDGVIIPQVENPEAAVIMLRRLDIPFVLIRRRLKNQPAAPFVDSDDESGVFDLVTHLVQLGHVNIAYLGSRLSPNAAREAGYRRAIATYGLPLREEAIVHVSDDHYYESAGYLMQLPDRPTAVVCYDDPRAVALLHWCFHHGINVPGDLSIASFGDDYIAQKCLPALTTVRLPTEEMVNASINALFEAITSGGPVQIARTFPTKLIVRDSTAPR